MFRAGLELGGEEFFVGKGFVDGGEKNDPRAARPLHKGPERLRKFNRRTVLMVVNTRKAIGSGRFSGGEEQGKGGVPDVRVSAADRCPHETQDATDRRTDKKGGYEKTLVTTI